MKRIRLILAMALTTVVLMLAVSPAMAADNNWWNGNDDNDWRGQNSWNGWNNWNRSSNCFWVWNGWWWGWSFVCQPSWGWWW
jgi:hypothetical protein